MSLWTINVNGVTRSPQGWGIDSASLKFGFKNWQADEFTFSMTEASVLEDPIFAFRDPVIVYKDDVKWFVGRITKPSASATNSGRNASELQRYIVKNAWNDLENLVYEQGRNTKTEADAFAEIHVVPTTRAILAGRVGAAGIEKVDTKDAITDLLDYAIAEGMELAYDVNFTPVTPPFEEGSNLTVAAAIRRMIAWTPDAAMRWDYTVTPPKLYIRRRATETALSIDLLDWAATGLVEYPVLDADYELVPAGVEITLQGGITNPTDQLRYAAITRQNAKIVSHEVAVGSVVVGPDRSRIIRGNVVLAADGTLDTEASLSTLAAEIADALKELFWNVEMSFKALEVPGTYRPGKLLNFLNGQTEWATAKAIVQEVTEVPAQGLTTVRCGRPPWLQRGTLDEINRRIADIRNPTNAVGTFYPGFTSHPDAPDAFGLREYTFDLAGWTFPGTAVHGSATFTVQLTSRISCDIKLTAFSLIYDILGTSIGLATWHTYDATDAEVSSSLYTPSSLPLPGGAKLGHPTGTFKVRFRLNGAAGPEDAVYTVSVPSTGTPATLKVALNANP